MAGRFKVHCIGMRDLFRWLITRQAVAATIVLVVVAGVWYWQDQRVYAPVSPPVEVQAPVTEEEPKLLPQSDMVAGQGGTAAPADDTRPASATGTKPTENPFNIRIVGHLEIPKLDLSVPVVYVDQKGEDAFQAALKLGVTHYPGSANAGQVGNMFIFGHSSDYRWSTGSYKKVFARLPELKAGDTVIAVAASGARFTYRVTGSAVVGATETKYLSQDTDGMIKLTLQTSYPIGTALKRYLVFTELVL